MIEKMTKYSFVLLSGKAEDFLTRLESLGLVDVTRSTKPVDEKSSELFTSVGEIRKAVGKLSQADWSKDPDLERIEAAACDSEFKDLPGSVSKAFARLETLMSEMAAARKACEAVRPWGRFDRQALDSLSAEGLKVRWYNVSKKKYDPSWAALQPLVEVSDNGSRVWFVTVSDDPEYSFPAEECPAPEGDLDFMQRKIESLREETIACKGEILALKKHLPELEEMAAAEEARLQRYLAEAGNAEDLAEKIRLLCDDPEKRREMGEAGRQRMAENDYRRQVKKLADLYDRIETSGEVKSRRMILVKGGSIPEYMDESTRYDVIPWVWIIDENDLKQAKAIVLLPGETLSLHEAELADQYHLPVLVQENKAEELRTEGRVITAYAEEDDLLRKVAVL